jgi:hypothetical protein
MELTLIKTKTYKLEPYGHFVFKWQEPRGGAKPHHIVISELNNKFESAMPLSKEQDNEIVKFMKKHKTDVLTDGFKFYTRNGDDLVEIWHEKLAQYKKDEAYRSIVDAVESFR